MHFILIKLTIGFEYHLLNGAVTWNQVEVEDNFFRLQMIVEQHTWSNRNEAQGSMDHSQYNSQGGKAGVFQDSIAWLHPVWLLQYHPLIFEVSHTELWNIYRTLCKTINTIIINLIHSLRENFKGYRPLWQNPSPTTFLSLTLEQTCDYYEFCNLSNTTMC